jgi:hypothetical protein
MFPWFNSVGGGSNGDIPSVSAETPASGVRKCLSAGSLMQFGACLIKAGSLTMDTALENSTKEVQEGDCQF